MFRFIEHEDGSTAVFDRSSGSLVSMIPKRRKEQSTSLKRQNPNDDPIQSDLKRIKKNSENSLLLNPSTVPSQQKTKECSPTSPTSLLISALPLVHPILIPPTVSSDGDGINSVLGFNPTVPSDGDGTNPVHGNYTSILEQIRNEKQVVSASGEKNAASCLPSASSSDDGSTKRRLRSRNTQQERFQSLLDIVQSRSFGHGSDSFGHGSDSFSEEEGLNLSSQSHSQQSRNGSVDSRSLNESRRSEFLNESRRSEFLNESRRSGFLNESRSGFLDESRRSGFLDESRSGLLSSSTRSLVQGIDSSLAGYRTHSLVNSNEKRSSQSHYVIVYKRREGKDEPSPARLRRLPAVTLNKLRNEFDTIARNDFSLSNQQSRLSRFGQHSIVTGGPMFGHRSFTDTHNSIPSDQNSIPSGQSLLLPSTTNGTNTGTRTQPGTTALKSVQVTKSTIPEPTDQSCGPTGSAHAEMASFLKNLNLIPRSTLKKVPLSDLKNTWPLRMHARSSSSFKSKAYNLMLTPPFMKSKSSLVTRSCNSSKSLLAVRSTNSVYRRRPFRNGHFGSKKFTSIKRTFDTRANFDNSNNRSFHTLRVQNSIQRLTPAEHAQQVSKEEWIRRIKAREPFVSLQSTPQMVVSFGSRTYDSKQHLIMKPAPTREQLLQRQAAHDHEVMMKSALESKEENKVNINKFIKKFMFDQIAIDKPSLELASPLGRRIIKSNYFLQFNPDNNLLMIRMIRIRDRNCSTNPYYNKFLLNSVLYSAPAYKVDLSFESLIKPNCLSVRTLRSLTATNPMTWCWGLKSYHLYTFSKQERLEKNLTLKTGLDWKSRLLVEKESEIKKSSTQEKNEIKKPSLQESETKISPPGGENKQPAVEEAPSKRKASLTSIGSSSESGLKTDQEGGFNKSIKDGTNESIKDGTNESIKDGTNGSIKDVSERKLSSVSIVSSSDSSVPVGLAHVSSSASGSAPSVVTPPETPEVQSLQPVAPPVETPPIQKVLRSNPTTAKSSPVLRTPIGSKSQIVTRMSPIGLRTQASTRTRSPAVVNVNTTPGGNMKTVPPNMIASRTKSSSGGGQSLLARAPLTRSSSSSSASSPPSSAHGSESGSNVSKTGSNVSNKAGSNVSKTGSNVSKTPSNVSKSVLESTPSRPLRSSVRAAAAGQQQVMKTGQVRGHTMIKGGVVKSGQSLDSVVVGSGSKRTSHRITSGDFDVVFTPLNVEMVL